MAKSSFKQIDLDEKRIIDELQKNSSKSIDKIADDCGFSRQKVWRIMKRLEENKTIWGYTAIIDDKKRGFNHYMILIKKTTQPVDEKLANTIISRKLEDLTLDTGVKIEYSMFVHGVYDWFIYFKAKDIMQAKRFSEAVKQTYKGYIEELQLLETLFPIRIQGILNPDLEKLKEFI